ncbi:dihydrolipoyllysine-residue acetyltransferase [Panacagrimonas sp.]|uniref:dihydrolipoyllysine-residue acetyltransferase n=1 Tax=Panacagrimonas sp. TaxID=2480088 RepID=UPI003B52BD2F
MGKLIEVQVPDIGDYQDVPVIEVLVKDGDTVEKDQALIVLESDKSTMEVPSPGAGVVRGFKIKTGDKLSQGDRICRLEPAAGGTLEGGDGDAASQTPAPTARPAAAPTADLFSDDSAAKAADPAPSPRSPVPSARIAVTVPDIGDFKDVPVIELLVAEGDAVEKDQALLVLESEKSTMEVPAPQAGTVRGLKVKVGDKLSQGNVLLDLETAGGDADAAAAPAPATEDQAPAVIARPAAEAHAPPALLADAPSPSSGSAAHAGPATRKFARELGVELGRVKGSGPKGRVVVEDVQKFVKQQMTAPSAATGTSAAGGAGIPPIPAQDFSQYGEIEEKPLARIRKLSAAHLHRAWLNIPHVTQNDEADITELEAFRKSASEGGVKLTLLPFVMKATAAAIRQFPEFGSSLAPSGDALIMKKYCHIGFAADTPNGLVVPVVRDVWSKGIAQLAVETAELASKAREGKLKPNEMKGGCFSISSLGGIGGSHFTPIVNAPEVGILGVSRGVMKPVWDGKAFQPRLMLPLSLSYDHRVIDGAYAARFIVALAGLLGDIRRLSL